MHYNRHILSISFSSSEIRIGTCGMASCCVEKDISGGGSKNGAREEGRMGERL